MEGIYQRDMVPDPDNLARNYRFLQKLYDLCAKQEIQSIFYIAPTMGRIPQHLIDTLQKTIASEMPKAHFLNCNDYTVQIDADPTRDYFDTLHYNASGAEKFSRFLGDWINQYLALTSQQQEESLWQHRASYFASLSERPLSPRNS